MKVKSDNDNDIMMIMIIISQGINLRTGEKGIFPLAHVVDVDYNDFDPSGVEVRTLQSLLSLSTDLINPTCHLKVRGKLR